MEYSVISIIIPCYNAVNYIDRCLQSLFSQTYPMEHMEIVCVNDASTDQTLDVLKSWEERYPENLIVIDCPENGHLGKARNIGLEYTSGEWIAFIDADDWVEKEYLELLYEASVKNGADLAGCKERRDASEGLTYITDQPGMSYEVRKFHIDSVEERKAFFRQQPLKLYAWGKLIRKSLLMDNGIVFPEYLSYEDIVWGNMLNMCVSSAVLVDREMYHYYINPGSIVLKKNELYHMDHLTTQELMWAVLVSRGYAEEYLPELKYEYLYNGYLAMLKILAFRYDEPSYSAFLLLQELTRSKVTEADCRGYLNDKLVPEMHRLLFGMIHQDVSRSCFDTMMEILRKSGL